MWFPADAFAAKPRIDTTDFIQGEVPVHARNTRLSRPFRSNCLLLIDVFRRSFDIASDARMKSGSAAVVVAETGYGKAAFHAATEALPSERRQARRFLSASPLPPPGPRRDTASRRQGGSWRPPAFSD